MHKSCLISSKASKKLSFETEYELSLAPVTYSLKWDLNHFFDDISVYNLTKKDQKNHFQCLWFKKGQSAISTFKSRTQGC